MQKRIMKLERWDYVRAKVWNTFYAMPVSEKSFNWIMRRHKALMRIISIAPILLLSIAYAEPVFDVKTISKANIEKTVVHLQNLATDAQNEANKANADLVIVQNQLAIETKQHADALVESDDLQKKVNTLQADDNSTHAALKSALEKLAVYARDLWFLAFLTGVALAYVGEKLVPFIPAGKVYLMCGGFVLGAVLVGLAHLMKWV